MTGIRRVGQIDPTITTFEDQLLQAVAAGQRAGFTPTEIATQPQAEINGGRWIIQCPTDGAGVLGDPDWTQGACISCGSVFYVQYPNPDDVAAIEAALMLRPDETSRNWLPWETVLDLLKQNSDHGLIGL